MQHVAVSNTANRASVLSLLRRCFRSAQKMPDPNHRGAYYIHIRDVFHRQANLPPNSREAMMAYRDGLDQVEQMEYYHQMKKKQNEEKPSITYSETSPQKILFDPPKHEPMKVIAQWLLQYLPRLSEEDLTKYSQRFIDEGFDSIAFIEEELLDEDLSFMKKAHRRVIVRHISRERDSACK